jgi:hypothetical protein
LAYCNRIQISSRYICWVQCTGCGDDDDNNDDGDDDDDEDYDDYVGNDDSGQDPVDDPTSGPKYVLSYQLDYTVLKVSCYRPPPTQYTDLHVRLPVL